VAAKTVQRCADNIARLYEQGADNIRIGEYLRRWLRWCKSGMTHLTECAVLAGLRVWVDDVGGDCPVLRCWAAQAGQGK
jgi:RNA-directed DNA polymerase